jgi:nucleoside-diphosphate-sugar epimerase
MKLIITGFSGFVAKNVFANLDFTRYEKVTILSRDTFESNDFVEFFNYDEFLEKSPVIYDCWLSIASDTTDSFENLFLSDFNCTLFHELIVKLRFNVSRVIHISSASLAHNQNIFESLYLQSKLFQETLLRKSGIDFVILRLSSPIGPGMNPNRIFAQMVSIIKQGLTFEFRGDIQRLQNYIDIRDVTRNILEVIDDIELNGLYYLSSPNSISNLTLFEVLKEGFSSKSSYVYLDSFSERGLDININDHNILYPNHLYFSVIETAALLT